MTRQLIVNADDFGFSHDVNRGIVEAHTGGILTATTLMANGEAFDDAVRLARATPTLDIGVHSVLVQGRSVLHPERELPATLRELVQAVALRGIDPYKELRAQVEEILAAGIRPTHLDAHKHTHILPPVLDALCCLGREYGIPWIRRPFDLPLEGSGNGVPPSKRLARGALLLLRGKFQASLRKYGCRSTDHFAGFQLTGRFHAAQLLRLFAALPAGSTEFMCHPGRCTDELRGRATRLKESREAELEALLDPSVRVLLEGEGIELTTYSRLSAAAAA